MAFRIQGRAMLYPEPVFIIKSHGLASNDGFNVWESKEKLHTTRRRWFKWWNMLNGRLLAAMKYLSGEKGVWMRFKRRHIYHYCFFAFDFLSPITYSNSRDLVSEIESEDENLLDDEAYDEDFSDMSEDDDL
ncbi:MAG: hypothetical protein U0Z26_02330 [Anaerolineales bacterium]